MDKSNNTPKLSVVIPCFNKEDYLIKMISCIMRQTFKDWELILVDDGSAEESFNKVHDFVSTDNRIQHIRRHRLPKNGDTCRNIGMDMAKGEYIIIFDADDLISETCFENRVKFMDEHPTCDYASFPYSTFIDGKNGLSKPVLKTEVKDILCSLLSTKYPFTVWANIYKKKALDSIRWDEKVYVYQDFDFMVQCALKNLKHMWGDHHESDYFYREFLNGNNVCGNYVDEKKYLSTNYLFNKILNQAADKQYKEYFLQFVILHFERLLLGGNIEYTKRYIETVVSHYGFEITNKCNFIVHKIYNKWNDRIRKILIDYYLMKYFGFPVYRIQLLHDIVKTLLRK